MTIARRRPVRKADGWPPLRRAHRFLLLYRCCSSRAPSRTRRGSNAAARRAAAGHFLCAVTLMQLGRSFPSCPRRAGW